MGNPHGGFQPISSTIQPISGRSAFGHRMNGSVYSCSSSFLLWAPYHTPSARHNNTQLQDRHPTTRVPPNYKSSIQLQEFHQIRTRNWDLSVIQIGLAEDQTEKTNRHPTTRVPSYYRSSIILQEFHSYYRSSNPTTGVSILLQELHSYYRSSILLQEFHSYYRSSIVLLSWGHIMTKILTFSSRHQSSTSI